MSKDSREHDPPPPKRGGRDGEREKFGEERSVHTDAVAPIDHSVP